MLPKIIIIKLLKYVFSEIIFKYAEDYVKSTPTKYDDQALEIIKNLLNNIILKMEATK